MNEAHPVPEAPITITVPASPASVRVVRLVAAAVAADLGFPIERLEDVRIVVDELAVLAGVGTAGASLSFDVAVASDELVLRVTGPGAEDELALAVLDALADALLRTERPGCVTLTAHLGSTGHVTS